MKRTFSLLIVMATVGGLLSSCGNSEKKAQSENNSDTNTIIQGEDGTISLKLEEADCYSDKENPSENTAEWNVVVSKSGRYQVWLTSATKDTTDLNYKNKVLISVQDVHLEGRPSCDRIVRNSNGVSHPYYRADSFIGSMYIRDPGEYNIQVISEQILPKEDHKGDISGEDKSKLLSVSFTPVKR